MTEVHIGKITVIHEPTCYNCQNFSICYLRRQAWDLVMAASNMVPESWNKELFAIIGKHCKELRFTPR